ncbi:GAF domain-containing protein, partial [Pseudonocardia pini]|uniref:GAF domain-containing protein n=1 Tax=Pseudonocardia pini TaxID=2758030 RepID=UPI0015F0B856
MSDGGPGGAASSARCTGGGHLADPARLRAVERTGLGPAPDPELDHLAAWVRRALGVPVSLVSLVQADRQVWPGRSGLAEPWATARSSPLSHSFCGHVVESGSPLAVTDARTEPLLRDSAAIPVLGMVAYAGVPVTDAAGQVLGTLCAIDTAPRRWTEDELQTLGDIARACSTELRLRLLRHDAGQDESRRDELEDAQQRALDRSQALLIASQAFTDTSTVDEVRARIGDLVATELRPTHVEVVLVDELGRTERIDATAAGDPALPETLAGPGRTSPATAAIRRRR